MNAPKVDTQFAKTGFMALPPWAKGVIAIGVGVGIYVIVKKVGQAPKKIKAGAGNRDEDKEMNKLFDNLETQGKKATLTPAQMSQYANQLHTAMDGYGTDEDSCKRILCKAKNDADVIGIIKSYGTREVSSGNWNPSPNYKGNLGGALNDELSDYWIRAINKCFKAKGIKHRM
jgi:hypothetical protein